MIIHDMEQGTDEWFAARLGVPTASKAASLLTTLLKPSKSLVPYAQKLAGDLYAGKDIDAWEGNIYTARGHEVEEEARLAYAMRGTPVDTVGFITDQTGFWGCSPDGLVGDEGLVEIKCLPKKHIGALMYYNKHKKAPPDYLMQCQMQMLVTNRAWCDLYYYHQDLPALCIQVQADYETQVALTEQLNLCIHERDRTLSILEAFDG